jgi:hypothetical protein
MIAYSVRPVPWERGWELHVDGVGVTQSGSLDAAEAMARDFIAACTGADPASFGVVVLPGPGG